MRARAEVVVEGRISDAEALWYDTSRRATFIDGFHHVVSVDPGWPARGTLVWDSTPGGRGRVVETVERYEPRVGQRAGIEDPSTVGTQEVAFATAGEDRVRMTLTLGWALKERRLGPLSSVVNAVFIRPRQREALHRTLVRFRRELVSDRGSAATS